jgi:hypothetical protein
MRTTLLNPTIWLLGAAILAGLAGALRGRTADDSIHRLLRLISPWPVVIVLGALALFGLASRGVLGFLSPGAYAEEVLAARTFLEQRELYGGAGEAASTAEQLGPTPFPLANVPFITPCQVNAMTNRARFFTNHAHTPMLLLAGLPVVQLGGGRALYLVLLLASLAAIGTMAGVLAWRAGVPWRSPRGILLFAAVAGWQPVLAGVRQGDAVLPAAGLVTLAWYLIGRQRSDRAAVAGALAACFAVPAVGVLPALWRTVPRAAGFASAIIMTAIATTVWIAGFGVVPGFLQTVSETARTYAEAPTNYAVAGRVLRAGAGNLGFAVALIGILVCSWWRGRTVDAAFGTFAVAGLMIAPVLWSQHLALLLIPVAVLFMRILRGGSSLALAAWALLALFCSLPDTAATRLGTLAAGPFGGSSLPIVPTTILLLWAWTTFGRVTHGSITSTAAPQAVVAGR